MTANEFAAYRYDAAGRIVGIDQMLWAKRTVSTVVGTATVSSVQTFRTPLSWSASYDARDRLIGFDRAGAQSAFAYDANGNRTSGTEQRTADTDLDGLYDADDFVRTTVTQLSIEASSNRLLGLTLVTTTQPQGQAGRTRTVGANIAYSLDANGSLTYDGQRELQYDSTGRLSAVRITRDQDSASVRYLHNALGQRVFKSEPKSDGAPADPAVVGDDFAPWLKKNFRWLFDQAAANASLGSAFVFGDEELPSWALFGEYDNGAAAGGGRTEYIWLPLDDGTAVPIGFLRGSQLHAVHTDHLGTPRLVTDASNTPVWQWPYSAFGDVKPTGMLVETANPRGAVTNQPALLRATAAKELNLRFPGQYFDQEAGTNYNYFRNYSAVVGRYVQSDPIGLKGGINTYAYVEGKPLSMVDRTGEAGALAILGGAAVTGYFTYKMFSAQNSCEKMCEITHGDAVQACGNPDRTDILDAQKNQRVLTCKASCAMGSVMSRLLPGKLK